MFGVSLPSICQRYEEIVQTLLGSPGSTEELVSLAQYLKNASEVTVHRLREEIQEAAHRLSFLLDCAVLPGG